jgi:hypothetical protein
MAGKDHVLGAGSFGIVYKVVFLVPYHSSRCFRENYASKANLMGPNKNMI